MTDNPAPDWPDRPALFLDLDGTLLEFADEPTAVEVPAGVHRLLGDLQEATSGAMALVSGRGMADLDRLLAPYIFPLAAVHGLVRRDGAGRISRTPVDEKAIADIERKLQAFVDANPGTLVEHKGVTLAVHFRKRPELEQPVIDIVESLLAAVAPGLMPMRGNRVVEIKPSGQDKGSAISAFMREPPFRGRTPVFIGDDVTDEDGFRAVNALGGVSIKVNSGETAATARLADISAVLAWLEQFASRHC